MSFKAAILLLISFGAFASEKKEENLKWFFDMLPDRMEDENQKNIPDDLFDLFAADNEKISDMERDENLYEENPKENICSTQDQNLTEDLITFGADQKALLGASSSYIVKDESMHNIPLQAQHLPQPNMQINPDVMSKIFKIASSTLKAMNAAQQQYVRVKDFYDPQAVAELGSKNDPESIVKNLKMEEYRRKVWGTQLTELVVKKKKLGFVKRKKNEPEISMFWHPENSLIKESFPIAFTYEGKFFKLKSYDISPAPTGKTRNHVNVRVSLTYETDLAIFHNLKNKIVLTVAQKQKTAESENKKEQEIIIESIFHNSTQIIKAESPENHPKLYFELLENSTKISFQEIKRIWESTENLEIIVAKNVEQKKYALTFAKRSNNLAGFLGTHLAHVEAVRELGVSYFDPHALFASLIVFFILRSVARLMFSQFKKD